MFLFGLVFVIFVFVWLMFLWINYVFGFVLLIVF